MTYEELSKQVVAVVAAQSGLPETSIENDSKLMEDLGMDSLDCVEFVMELEDTFKIQINDEDADKFLSVSNVCDYMYMRLNKDSDKSTT